MCTTPLVEPNTSNSQAQSSCGSLSGKFSDKIIRISDYSFSYPHHQGGQIPILLEVESVAFDDISVKKAILMIQNISSVEIMSCMYLMVEST